MADDWVDVPALAAPPKATDGWVDVPQQGATPGAGPQAPISGPDGWSTAAKGMVNSTSVGSIMRAFGEGFGEAWGPERLGLSKESTQWLSEKGIFAPAGQKNFENPFQAFNEGVIVNTASALDAAVRTASGVFRGAQAAGEEAGLPRDFVAAPEAFMGSPGGLGEIRVRPGLPKEVAEARDLGVIGPERPAIADLAGKPAAEIAETLKPREAAANARPGEKVTQEVGNDPWQQRFDQFVGKLNTPEDVKQLIRDAATENGQFPAARAGDIPLRDIENIADAAGVAPEEINAKSLGRRLDNDAKVRVAMQAMLQTASNITDLARDVRSDPSPENLIKFQEAIMRRDLAVEQVVGLRAEWGRTGNAIQEFQTKVKDQAGLSDFLKDKGRTPSDLKEIADGLAGINDPSAAAKILNNTRGKQMSPFYYYWVNGLISGLLTHTKYVAANAVYAASEHGVTTPIASIIGAAKKVAGVGNDAERVFFGEAMASTWGMLAATPTALVAAGRSIKAGVRPPLESEVALRNAAIARGERIPASLERAVNPINSGERPIPGIWGRIIGAPGDSAGAIHTFFKIIGERAGIEAEAYRKAGQEGLSPTDDTFWQRRANHAANPTDEMRQRALEGAYKGTFMQDLGPRGKAWQKMTKDIPGVKWIFPFAHIPINLMKATYEHTPFAMLDGEMRADIMGENGGIKQDKAIARMVVGSSIMGWFVNAQLTGKATGDYPKDPKERDQWKLAGKQPNSILIGDHWVSYSRFGPAGDLAGLGANIGTVIHHLQSEDDDKMTKATMHAALAAGKLMIDEAGFQSLQNIFEAYSDPDKRGAQFVASEASSFLPFSSLIGQTASYMDPDMREAKTFVDGLKYRIPGARESLLPKRDWSGLPVPNPQYHSILRTTQVKTDPVDQEMATLEIHPAPPQSRIGGVKLPPKLYDTYQATAGAFTRSALSHYVEQPGWHDLPPFVREKMFRATIEATRKSAAAAVQMQHPEIIAQGVQDRLAKINGVKPTKLQDASP
jgi:hypothetical protein